MPDVVVAGIGRIGTASMKVARESSDPAVRAFLGRFAATGGRLTGWAWNRCGALSGGNLAKSVHPHRSLRDR